MKIVRMGQGVMLMLAAILGPRTQKSWAAQRRAVGLLPLHPLGSEQPVK